MLPEATKFTTRLRLRTGCGAEEQVEIEAEWREEHGHQTERQLREGQQRKSDGVDLNQTALFRIN